MRKDSFLCLFYEGSTPKASRGLRCGERVSSSLLGVGFGVVLPPRKIFEFFYLKGRALVHFERHFCQEMLAGYSDYNTMFAGQTDKLKRK